MVYIVAAVLLDGDKVLLIQEAKPSCRGEWYLPAGRMEANETFVVSYLPCGFKHPSPVSDNYFHLV